MRLFDLAPHLMISGAIVGALAFAFLWFFLMPGIKHWLRLRDVLAALKGQDLSDESNPDQLTVAFNKDKHLAHLWNEYRKTLYAAMPVASGVVKTEWRSTVSAESFWNGQLVVDPRVHSEFFKHVPGIFTGLGIIGTFLGLIDGLTNFKVSSATQNGNVIEQNSVAETAQKSLESLMHAVGEAFLISAAAIICAMAATFLEKFILNALYSQTDEIADQLDARFEAKAPEKFLEQTATFAEESATQLKQLKSELLKDLKPILFELSEKQSQMLERLAGTFQERISETSLRQIEASRDNSTEMAGTISDAIRDGLKEPLEEIKAAVTQVSSDQSSNAVEMLRDVMTHFSQKINDLFGGQITGINQLNQQTAVAMEQAVKSLNELVSNLKDAGKSSTESMAEQMTKAIIQMEDRQNQITTSTQALLSELRSAIEQGQSATSRGIQDSSEEMARRMAEAVEKMELRQESINQRTQEFVEQIKTLVSSTQTETNTQLQNTLSTLGEKMGGMLEHFQTVQQGVISANQQREQETAQKTQDVVGTLANQSKEFVSEVAGVLSRIQTQSKEALDSTVEDLGGQVATTLKEIREAQRAALESGLQREQETAQKTQDVVGSLANRSKEFVSEIEGLLSRIQTQSKETFESTVQDLSGQVSSTLNEIREAQRASIESGLQREEAISQKTQLAIDRMVNSVDSLVSQIGHVSTKMHESVTTLTSTTKTAVSGLSDGADQVNSAARNFRESSDKVVGAMNQASTVTGKLAELTVDLTTVSTSLKQGIQDYSSHREAMASLMTDLNGLVTNAKTDVSITSGVLQRIEQATEKLSVAQFETEKFMQGVATVLAKAHEDFRTSVSNSLSKSNHEFQQKLSSAVAMLGTSISELDDTLSSLSPRRAEA